jgi:hypothetical protein
MPVGEWGVFVDLRSPERSPIGALELSSFLFDINRLYAVAFRAEQYPYEIDETRFRGYGRGSFRVPKQQQLDVSRIRFESPGFLILSTALTAATVVWMVIQIIDKVSLWPLQKAKLQLEIRKLQSETGLERETVLEPDKSPGGRRRIQELEDRIDPILALPVTQGAITQLSANPLKPTDLTVEIAHRSKDRPDRVS